MFIKGKPIRFGYKFWCLCSSDGYLYQFIPYGGASSINDNSYGLGENVVLQLLSHVPVPDQHTITFDNFFTSFKLICHLSSLGYFATGTVRETRTGKALLNDPKEMKKMKRGTSDFCFDINNEIYAIRWHDNSIVTVLSTCAGMEPMQQIKRFDRKSRAMINCPIPKALHMYNQTMGGVDLFDNVINNYRILNRGKKWYWPLFTNALDAGMVKAWKLHCVLCKFGKTKPMSQLDFRKNVIECLLRFEDITFKKRSSNKVSQSSAHDLIRYDCVNHSAVRVEK